MKPDCICMDFAGIVTECRRTIRYGADRRRRALRRSAQALSNSVRRRAWKDELFRRLCGPNPLGDRNGHGARGCLLGISCTKLE